VFTHGGYCEARQRGWRVMRLVGVRTPTRVEVAGCAESRPGGGPKKSSATLSQAERTIETSAETAAGNMETFRRRPEKSHGKKKFRWTRAESSSPPRAVVAGEVPAESFLAEDFGEFGTVRNLSGPRGFGPSADRLGGRRWASGPICARDPPLSGWKTALISDVDWCKLNEERPSPESSLFSWE
jgi:hypothetical protein